MATPARKKKPTRDELLVENGELQHENRQLRKSDSAFAIANIVEKSIPWFFSLLIVCALVYGAVGLAGKVTVANFWVGFFTNVSIDKILAWVLGVGGLGFGEYQRRKRITDVAKVTKRNSKLEQLFDPNRTSSGLTAKGELPIEDAPRQLEN